MTTFPINVIDVLAEELKSLPAGIVLRRALRPTDPDRSVGIYAMDWTPRDSVIGQFDPAVATYTYTVQAMVKHANEEEGRHDHAAYAQAVRLMLYRDPALRVRLAGLSETDGNVTERSQRWGVRAQRYASNEVDGEFIYLSTTEFWVETETV